MIISRTPYRVSLFGGTTDYQDYYSKHGSLLIGLAIDKYSYICGRKTPSILPYRSRFSYSENEIILDGYYSNEDYLNKIKHNGIRGVLKDTMAFYPLEISHFCDLPSQTGLGSSSSFITGLLRVIYKIDEDYYEISKKDLAKAAIRVERQILKEPGGIQDQIWAAYGGFNSISINKNGDFSVKPLPVSKEFVDDFISRSILLYTGKQRNSFEIAKHSSDSDSIKQYIHDLAKQAYQGFIDEDIKSIAELLHESWEAKKSINQSISNSEIDEIYLTLRSIGMIGGKLIGAGGSGFIFGLFDNSRQIENLKTLKHKLIPFNIDFDGSKIIHC